MDISSPQRSVSVLIVNYNTRQRTIECLESVVEQRIAELEIVVVDNGSEDGSAESIAAAFPDVIVDAAGENLGFARGVNRAASLSSGEFVLLLNPDTSVLPGSIEALVNFAVDHPRFGVYGGRTLHPDGTVDPRSCWAAPTLWSLFCFASLASTIFSRSALFDPESLGKWQRDTIREVPIVTGCLLLMRRDAFDKMGGMDERYFLYGEDAEFSLRAAEHGHRPVLVPQAAIVHDVGVSTSSSGRKMSLVMAGKTTLLRHRWSPLRRRIGLLFLITGVAVRAALEHRPGAGKSWTAVWRARADWLCGYPAAKSALFR